MIGVIDCGIGNVGSIVNMLKRIGAPATVVTRADGLREVHKAILPGVGAFDAGIARLESEGLFEPLRDLALREGKPLLGICLGAQMLTRRSEEGECTGLAIFDAQCRRFRPTSADLKVPHIGWNHVQPKKASALFDDFAEPPRFYFVHSYYIECADPSDVLTTTEYGHPFASAIQRGNTIGVQFHPEKSHRFGMQLLRSFAERLP
jgi:glutamine amidotransferase